MTRVEGVGFFAAGLVLCTSCMRRLVPLRGVAIASNLAFILYGYIAGIEPVLVLHLILLPVNIIRLLEALGANLPSALPAAVRRHRLFKDLPIKPL
jgi:CRP/FNR family cyclic AMP-dependent transcriptional regulator